MHHIIDTADPNNYGCGWCTCGRYVSQCLEGYRDNDGFIFCED